ncbi:class I SAM-dependent methyltransferase [Frankia sp. CiP3]|uniref:class I SAM-dependent methyltransferase n=1 Tax=Frankia sp. CiP3 TaxID=2880971 RepID=UPI001EF4D861|nr:class I SAM-dependent methyltransferase [Frankia sp. CiP3]
MRYFRHWTPRYAFDRVFDELHRRTHPALPWLTPQANEILVTLLRRTDDGLEFGSGRSTIWLANRVHHLSSVEHDDGWHSTVSAQLKEQRLQNVEYILAPQDVPAERGGESEYASTALRFGDASLDFVLVDGAYRDFCVKFAIPKIKPGGVLVLDNINWYLPFNSRSPNSRTSVQGADGSVWAEVQQIIQNWRLIWTSSGVWDTAFFFKP